ncbi:MAG: hypothetical protein Q9162_006387 [Coniocarpon cinnabarinum]
MSIHLVPQEIQHQHLQAILLAYVTPLLPTDDIARINNGLATSCRFVEAHIMCLAFILIVALLGILTAQHSGFNEFTN